MSTTQQSDQVKKVNLLATEEEAERDRKNQLRAKLRMALKKKQDTNQTITKQSHRLLSQPLESQRQKPNLVLQIKGQIRPEGKTLEDSEYFLTRECDYIHRPERKLQPPKGALYNITLNKKTEPQFYSKSTPKTQNETFAFKLKDLKGEIKKQAPMLRTRDENEAKNFFDYFPKFLERKKKKVGELIDLTVHSLSDIVDFCYIEKFIGEEDYHSFLFNRGTYVEKMYLEKFVHNRLDEFSFTKSRFTLFDHRRLVALLLKYYPEKYKNGGRPFNIQPDITNFLTQIYNIPEDSYWRKCLGIDKKYRLVWWSNILAKYSSIVPLLKDAPIDLQYLGNSNKAFSNYQHEEEDNEVCEILPDFKMDQSNLKQNIPTIKRTTPQGNEQSVTINSLPNFITGERKDNPQDNKDISNSVGSDDIQQDDELGLQSESQSMAKRTKQKKKKGKSKKDSVGGKNRCSDDDLNDFGFGSDVQDGGFGSGSDDFNILGQDKSMSRSYSRKMGKPQGKKINKGMNLKKGDKINVKINSKINDDEFFSSLDEASEKPMRPQQKDAQSDLDLDEVNLDDSMCSDIGDSEQENSMRKDKKKMKQQKMQAKDKDQKFKNVV